MPTRFPGNGTYNARRYDAARKALADAMAAPVFTDDERQRAAVNAWTCASLYQLIKWTRNVTRVAAERAVAAAKARTLANRKAQYPSVDWAAHHLLQARYHVQTLVEDVAVFSPAERQAAIRAAFTCDDLAQVRRWGRNLARLRQDREDQLWLSHELGFPTGPLSAQRGPLDANDHRGGLAA